MLSERITAVFGVLGCNNSDIAGCVGCSPSNIRLIHANKRNYSPNDKPIALLADGIYSYADKENQLATLIQLCHASGSSREILIPSLVAWLFDTDENSLSKINTVSTRKKKEAKNRSFGEKLNSLMNLLELSNARLARTINIDDSYISRFRNGVRSPMSDSEIARLIAEALYKRALEQQCMTELAKFTDISAEILFDSENGIACFSSWLYEVNKQSGALAIDHLLECIDNFLPQSKIPLPEISDFVNEQTWGNNNNIYWGTDGLRRAVIRFLANTSKFGGDLWLYSDQNIEWLVGDENFLTKWNILMLACIKNGTRIRIIHYIDRGTEEMISAIQSWLPLYMSGMIEPYVCRGGHNSRFSHTLFLRPGAECINGTHLKGTEENGCYDYIVDTKRLLMLSTEFEKLISQAQPLIKIHIGDNTKLFTGTEAGDMSALLSTLSLGTLPPELLDRILMRSNVDKEESEQIREFCEGQRKLLSKALKSSQVYEFVPLPSDDDLFGGKVRLNLATSLHSTELFYTPEEYAFHISAIAKLHEENAAYHFFKLPEPPFSGIQIIQVGHKVTVIRSGIPYAAFTFTEPLLTSAFTEYFATMKEEYRTDRAIVRKTLGQFL